MYENYTDSTISIEMTTNTVKTRQTARKQINLKYLET